VAGGKAKYYKRLPDWNRRSARDIKRLAGVTGASVGAGRKLTVTADLADALIDAGYEIRIDAAVEDQRDSPSEVRVPLTRANASQPQAGKQYIQSLTYQLQEEGAHAWAGRQSTAGSAWCWARLPWCWV